MNQSIKPKKNQTKNNPFKEYFQIDEEENKMLQNSFTLFSGKYFGNIIGEKEFKETAIEAKINRQLNGKIFLKRKTSIYISSKEIKQIKLEQSLRDIGVLKTKEEEGENLTLRKLPELSDKKYIEIKNTIIDKDTFTNLYDQINNTNIDLKNPDCNISIGGISPLTYLIEHFYKFDKNNEKEMKVKYDLLKPYIYCYRTIYGDGNCFYRAAIFRYLEIIVLNKDIAILKRIVFDVMKSFTSEELKSRRIILKKDIKPDLTFKILFLIIDLLEKNMIPEAHQILFKSFSTCRNFDYAIILYFRYILYDYIKKNENKIYLESFPIKIGNLLPSQYETDSGDFLFKEFYENYLLKFYTDAEKIIVYLTPFVLGMEINVIVFDLESDTLQKFIYEGKSEIKNDNIISILNKNNHYEIIYTKNEEEKHKNYYLIFEKFHHLPYQKQ